MEIYNNIRTFGIKDEWDFDKKRAYRQVNEFNLFLCLISFSAIPIALVFKVYLGLIIQILCFFLYLAGFLLLSRELLKQARLLAIYTFETQLFFVTFFAVYPTNEGFMPWYSPVFIVYIIYPIIAALFDKPIFKHMFFGLFQIFMIQFTGAVLTKINLMSFPESHLGILTIIVCVYTLGIGSLIVHLVYSENKVVKTLEIERSKQLQKALKELELSNTMINDQTIELQKLNDSKNKLFSIIAHDLKSPYNVILGFSEILKEKSINDPEYYEYAKNLYDTAIDNYSLLENLLEWSRTQMDHIQYKPSVFPLNDVIYKTLNLLGVSAEKKNIAIKNEVSNSLSLFADRTLVSIIVRNIITNAIKFTRSGGSIIIGAEIKKREAEVFIKDNGIGMPEETLKDLFKIEYIQSRKGTSAEAGTGLGLILCKEFIEMHNGEIRAESKEKVGTTFYFTLPLA